MIKAVACTVIRMKRIEGTTPPPPTSQFSTPLYIGFGRFL